jgi:hypothetical protein
MSQCLSISASAAADAVSWTPTQDYLLTAIAGRSTALITADPSMTIAKWTLPGSTGLIDENFIAAVNAAGTNTFNSPIPIMGGRTYFICFSAAGYVMLYLDEPS